MKQDSYTTMLGLFEGTIYNPNFYWQLLSIMTCLIVSYFLYRASKKVVFPIMIAAALKKDLKINKFLDRYIFPLLYSLLSVFCLAIGLSIYSQFFTETIIFSTILKLITLFLFLRFLRISSNNKFIANAAGFFLIPSLILDTLGLLDSTIDYLDHYALEIGAFRISIYLIMKAFIVLLTLFCISALIIKKSKLYVDRSTTIKSSTKGIIGKFIDIAVYSTVTIIILKTFGVDMTTFAVLGGAIGVGIGFGLQKIASNFISGIILLFEKSVEVGDWVEIDNGETLGVIKYFGGRYTLLERFDGKEIMVPNEEFIINKVTNLTYSNNRARIEINLGVAHGTDLEEVQRILTECAAKHPRCLSYPGIDCFVTDFGDYSIKFTLFFWVSDITQGRMSAKSVTLMEIWKEFKKHNICIPFPQREVSILKND